MKIGIVDLEFNHRLSKMIKGIRDKGKIFPNLPLMKLSAYHKKLGDEVDWYFGGHHVDKIYISKVFSFTPDEDFILDADEISRGGSGYCIGLVDGVEVFDDSKHQLLPYKIEHIYPDYSLYNITDTAYGFMQRGCPRECGFCPVSHIQGNVAHKVADLSEFWNGQKNIVLLDPNITITREWKDIFQQLIDSKAYIDFTQGLDIRCMTREKTEMLMKMKINMIHFSWDNYDSNNDVIKRKLKEFSEITGRKRSKITVYVLTNFNTTFEQDLERVMYIRSLNIQPYVMRYDKEHIPRGHILNQLARWVNSPPMFWKYKTFDEYLLKNRHGSDEFKQMTIFDY